MRSSQEDKDAQLVSSLVTGDREAFAIIYRTYASALINYARKSIPAKEDCEEIVQEVFESLWARHEVLHHVTVLRTYLFKMVRYKIVDYIRHSLVKKRYEAYYILFEAVPDDLHQIWTDPSEIQLLIDKGVSGLPERCQTAFRLRYDDNLPYKDIAVLMNISCRTVEKHISSALQHLRSVYQEAARQVKLQ